MAEQVRVQKINSDELKEYYEFAALERELQVRLTSMLRLSEEKLEQMKKVLIVTRKFNRLKTIHKFKCTEEMVAEHVKKFVRKQRMGYEGYA